MVDTEKLAAIGYCFGGMPALDLARSGAPLIDVVTFHGALGTPQSRERQEHQGARVGAARRRRSDRERAGRRQPSKKFFTGVPRPAAHETW
jgi:dienelactone hydrolase